MCPANVEPGSPEQWLRYAEADLSLARIPLPEQALYEQLCFHAQQAAEKGLKAALVHLGIDFPNTHNLGALVDLVPRIIPRPDLVIAAATELTPYSVSFRYPGAYEPVEKEEYMDAVRAAELILDWAKDLIGNVRQR